MATKLELTWYGKEKEIKVEPRILIENSDLSNIEHAPETENMLIHGDNLLALKALESKYAGKVKCIYIDPPFNTGAAFEHYNDNLQHSIWLDLMYKRFRIIYNLLSENGCIFVNLDDSESAYCKILLDEIFGRKNYLNEIIVATNKSFGFKSTSDRFFKQANHLLFYAKNISVFLINSNKLIIEKGYDSQYKWQFIDTSKPEKEWKWKDINEIVAKKMGYSSIKEAKKDKLFLIEVSKYAIENAGTVFRTASVTGGALIKRKNTIEKSRLKKNEVIRHPNDDMDYMFIGGERVIFYKERLKEIDGIYVPVELITDIWNDISVEGLASEGGVNFPKGKKPEKLIQRCLEITSNPGDLVLDSFLGSGTTAAVAHKMGRKYIGIEMGNHAYSHCKVRLDKVISGEDKSGITKTVNWQGGGGYRFYELAPSLILKDDFDEPVINKDYSPELLASAVALHEGFIFKPDDTVFWKQSVGTENSYLFVTTRHVTQAYLDSIADSMKEDEFLVIACKSYEAEAAKAYKNITIKKIPQMLLDKCEFSKDNYNLNIINPPVYDYDGEDDNE